MPAACPGSAERTDLEAVPTTSRTPRQIPPQHPFCHSLVLNPFATTKVVLSQLAFAIVESMSHEIGAGIYDQHVIC